MSKKRKYDQLREQDDSKTTHPQSEESAQATVSADSTKSKAQLKQEKAERKARKQERSERRAKKQKKSKDAGKEQDLSTSRSADIPPESAPATDGSGKEDIINQPEVKSKKSEKRRKTQIDNTGGPEEDITNEAEVKSKKSKKKSKDQDDTDEKTSTPARFIVFVGNLPYDVTVDQIKAHFSKISPSSVRLATAKGTGKSKGFAFLEFDNYDKMKTCLKLYHHSLFDPEAREKERDVAEDGDEQTGRGAKKKGRRINVELTAGGGGKSKERKDKIKSKNQKLEEERERRRLREKAEKETAGPKKHAAPETGANATEIKDTRGDIHPSRLSRVSH
ncbi:hypothetical protein H2200_007423 [Cladophialophora chaetospira]|uniref:RRM domain-containing protein n=1 Tax=Cladophialophora chaetospira TaxID=386627 RepID=A0AA38X7R9_9EURO|nr:hypothetical protein H2200_007423 [Cladophialophora chaetospira]